MPTHAPWLNMQPTRDDRRVGTAVVPAPFPVETDEFGNILPNRRQPQSYGQTVDAMFDEPTQMGFPPSAVPMAAMPFAAGVNVAKKKEMTAAHDPGAFSPYAPGVNPGMAQAFTARYPTTPPPGAGGGGGGLPSGHDPEMERIMAEMRAQGEAFAREQRDTQGHMKDNLGTLLGTELQYDLSPLAALVDQWSGSNMAGSYQRPESVKERRGEIYGKEKDIAAVGNAASQTDLATLREQFGAKFDMKKVQMDQAYKNAQLGLQKEGLGLDRARLEAEKIKASMKTAPFPLEVKTEITALANKNASKIAIVNQLKGYLTQYKAAKTDDQKIGIGRSMLKTLNSAEGADAIGAEEAKRFGALLEHNKMNLFEPGPVFGRDLGAFKNQAEKITKSIEDAVILNRNRITELTGGQPAGQPSGGGERPQTVYQDGQEYTLNPQTGEYE